MNYRRGDCNRLKLSRDKYSKLVNDSVHCVQVMWRSNVGLIQHRFEKLICAHSVSARYGLPSKCARCIFDSKLVSSYRFRCNKLRLSRVMKCGESNDFRYPGHIYMYVILAPYKFVLNWLIT